MLATVGYPLLFMSAVMLQLFTGLTAYNMVRDDDWRVPAAIAAFALPPLSDMVVAYYAWRASGSMRSRLTAAFRPAPPGRPRRPAPRLIRR